MELPEDLGQAIDDSGGALGIRDHPHLERRLQRWRQAGLLTAPLPGVFVRAENREQIETRIRAASIWSPGAVITGAAAARCTFWPEIRVATIALSFPERRLAPAGYRLTRERLPADVIYCSGSIRLTVPGLTALDLVAVCGGAGIDQALRVRAATLADMHAALALTPNRRGNAERRLLLHDSRDEPWSEAERSIHRLLRTAGIKGWETNWPVVIEQQFYRIDVAFPALRVAIEIDGYEFHKAELREQFERDREKSSRLTAAGWRVLRFTWRQLCDSPDWVLHIIRRTCALAVASRSR